MNSIGNNYEKNYDILTNLRKKLRECVELNSLIDNALRFVKQTLNVQVASIYLIDKEGLVRRQGICGTTCNKEEIKKDWFSEESHKPGESFTALAIPSSCSSLDSKCLGKIWWSNNLNNHELKKINRKEYEKLLGKLKSAIAVPLNGTNRTFGALEIINKLDINNEAQDFLENDVILLTTICSILEAEITLYRKTKESEIFKELSQRLITIPNESSNDKIYRFITESLTNDFMPYTCCILRKISDGCLEKPYISAPGISLEERNNERRPIDNNSIIGKVVNFKMPILINDISKNIDQYDLNKGWVNKYFKSHACYPLIANEQCVGTLSILTSYNYTFYSNEEAFIKTLCSLLASYIQKEILEAELLKAEEEIRKDQDMIIRSASFIGTDTYILEISHRYKNELSKYVEKLLEISTLPNSKRDGLIEEQIRNIKERIDKISSTYLSPDVVESVNVNSVARKVLKLAKSYNSKNYNRKNNNTIIFRESYDQDLPLIQANTVKIESVFFNILINSINAIHDSGRHEGVIEIATGFIQSKTRSEPNHIQVIIRDNGIGMEKDIFEKIFEKGYSKTQSRGGTGIGLFVCKEIIHSYKGSIEVWSDKGSGTMFTISIPIS